MIYEGKFELARISLKRDSSNSCKPSSTNGFKKVVQNNRIKSNKKPGREKGHKRSAPQVCLNPDKTIHVSKVATCSCGCHTIEKEDVKRALISLEIIVHTTQYVGKKTVCPCCNKEYQPKFPNNVNSIVNYDETIKSLIVYLTSPLGIDNSKLLEVKLSKYDMTISMSASFPEASIYIHCLNVLVQPPLVNFISK